MSNQNTTETLTRLALRPVDAAKALAISPRTLFTLTKAGDIPCTRVGRAVLYRPADLDKWLQSKTQKGN